MGKPIGIQFCPLPKKKACDISKNKNAPIGSIFFPYRLDPFLEVYWHTENKQEVSEVVSRVKNDGDSFQVYPFIFR